MACVGQHTRTLSTSLKFQPLSWYATLLLKLEHCDPNLKCVLTKTQSDVEHFHEIYRGGSKLIFHLTCLHFETSDRREKKSLSCYKDVLEVSPLLRLDLFVLQFSEHIQTGSGPAWKSRCEVRPSIKQCKGDDDSLEAAMQVPGFFNNFYSRRFGRCASILRDSRLWVWWIQRTKFSFGSWPTT